MNVDLTELDDRISKCQRILDDNPNSQIFAALAEAYRKRKMNEKAMEVCRKGLEIHSDYASAYIVMAKIYMDLGNYEEADHQLKKAIEFGGRTRSSDLLQSEIFLKMGHKEKARTVLSKLYKSDPMNESVKRLLISIEGDDAAPRPAKPLSSVADMDSESRLEPPKRTYNLSQALNIIKILPRVLGILAVDKHGMVIEGHFEGSLSKDQLGALASGAFDNITTSVGKIKLGKPREVLIESEQSKLWLLKQDKMLIVVSMRDDVNFGSLKLKANDIFKNTIFA
jgi:predicted regulator of Ras-like GTPase activity (Roadblock/LC7/MglB family)